MGVVHHGNFLSFFEVGRVDAMRQIGTNYAAVVARGLHLVVVSACARYLKPARFDDVLLVFTRATEIGVARFAFEYRVTREADDALIATGRTEHACVDASRMRPLRLPEWLVDDLRRLQ